MRLVIQRVSKAAVIVNNETVGSIDNGLIGFLGITHQDTLDDIKWLVDKMVKMRIFNDDEGKLNKSVLDKKYALLLISQFTLLGDTKKGNRPSFINAMEPNKSKDIYNKFIELILQNGLTVASGVFGAMMDITSVNDGPVTILIDSKVNT